MHIYAIEDSTNITCGSPSWGLHCADIPYLINSTRAYVRLSQADSKTALDSINETANNS